MAPAPVAAAESPAREPHLVVPARPDSTRIDSPPVPLLIPGRPYFADSLKKTRQQTAKEHLQRARKLESDGLPQTALVEYQNAAGLDPTLAGVFDSMGQLYEAFGMYPDAIQSFSLEVEHHPANRDAARRLGVALVRGGDTAKGIQQLELLSRSNPRDGASWRALGFAYSYAKRFRDAERALRAAIDLPPPIAEEYRDLGVLLANQGREREARDAYARAARLDAKDGTVWVNLGNLESRAGRPDAALTAYRTAEARDSSTNLAYRGQVMALEALGRGDEAGTTYRRWLRRLPDDDNARLEAVRWFAKRDRTDVALELGRDGVRRGPRSGNAHLVMAVAVAASGDARTALLELRRAEHFKADRVQVAALIAELRAGAPDSLEALFAADSLAAIEAARKDSTVVPGFTGRRPDRH